MKQTLFEQNGGTYTQQGDYLLPDIKLPDEPEYEIGVWGNRRRQYLKQKHRVKYYNMLTQCTLYPHLAEINAQAVQLEETLVNQFAAQEGVNEQLKAKDMMEWVRKKNGIYERAAEIIYTNLIYN